MCSSYPTHINKHAFEEINTREHTPKHTQRPVPPIHTYTHKHTYTHTHTCAAPSPLHTYHAHTHTHIIYPTLMIYTWQAVVVVCPLGTSHPGPPTATCSRPPHPVVFSNPEVNPRAWGRVRLDLACLDLVWACVGGGW